MKPVRKTLAIQRETIRTLMPSDLKQAAGGLVLKCTVDCGQTKDVSICECTSYQLSCR